MQLQVSEDGKEAHVVAVSKDFGGGREISVWDLKAALSERGVVEGICEDGLQSLTRALAQDEGYAGDPILVARGRPPGPGRDGKLVLLPPKGADLEKDKVTWLIFPGEKVATIVPPSRGEPGVTVRGEKIPGELGNEAKVKIGAGVELGKDGKNAVANVAGFAQFDRRSISVKCPVTLSRDKMTAYLNVIAPGRVVGTLEVDDYYKLLRSSAVIQGIKKKAIEKALKEAHETGKDKNGVVVAKGVESKPGEDAKIEYTFSLDIEPGLLLPDGKMDYRERSLIQNVAAGQELAVKIPPTAGTPGTTVTGDQLAPRPGRDVPLRPLENVELSEDGLKLIAKREGMAVLDRSGGVRVVSEFVVRGDVDYSTGNVRCKGSVKIEGSVLPDFSVESEQDILIDGGVDSANVHAGSNLVVGHGIQGSASTEIVVGGEIRARFIENANVNAVGDIILGQSVRHSDVRTAGTLKVTERKGTIVGGRILATRGILGNELGSELGTRTDVSVGVDASKFTRIEELERKIDECEADLRRMDAQLGPAAQESKKTELDADRKSWLAKLLKERAKIVSERDKFLEQRDKLAGEMQSDLSAKVRILGKVHSGVVVRIGEATYSVGDTKRNVTFLYDEERREIACIEEG